MDGEKKHSFSEEELRLKLNEQIGFLIRSADDFDNGHSEEAVRLAATLRILLHDTNRSKSLLGQLGKKDIAFCDTSDPNDPENIAPYYGLISLELGPSTARYVARLDDVGDELKHVGFKEWWNMEVFRDARKGVLSRKTMILSAADQDGGAHVDPVLDHPYSAYAIGEAIGWRFVGKEGEKPVVHPARVAIRQIAHEVLKTLVPGYAKMPKLEGTIIRNIIIKPIGPGPEQPSGRTPVQKKGIGRRKPRMLVPKRGRRLG